MIEGSCHCGAVRFTVAQAPTEVASCNCSICRRLGNLWSYYPVTDVSVTGETDTYAWSDRDIAFHRCKVCGCSTHWSPLKPGTYMGVNARLFDPGVIADLPVRHLDNA